jgi:hypothetical protein
MSNTNQIQSLRAQCKELSRQLDAEIHFLGLAKANKDRAMILRAQEAIYKLEGDIFQFKDIADTMEKRAA